LAKTWRLLDTGSLSAAENMALDEALLLARGQGNTPSTLRFLQFRPSCALLGYHQVAEDELDLAFCEANGIEVNRRLTGGGAIFCHESQIGWELVLAEAEVPYPRGTPELGAWACRGAILGLQQLGLQARFAGKNDLLVGGRKVGGSGGVSLGGGHLIHGSLLVELELETMLRVLRISPEKLSDKSAASAAERLTCLAFELGQAPEERRIKQALVAGFAESMSVELVTGLLTQAEEALLRQALPRFRSQEWVLGLDRPLGRRRELTATLKLPGGLVHVSLSLQPNGRLIDRVRISGDFSAHPPDAIARVEAGLHGVRAEAEALRATVEEIFAATGVSIPGVEAAGLVAALSAALTLRSRAERAPEEGTRD
jgi:lipoate---protein ligase